jgi:hypothetical protein
MITVDKIGIGVVTSSNLKKRYNVCKNTWLKDFENTYLFGGNGNDPSLINITEAGEDYRSHFLKQQLGLKYMYDDNDSLNWYCMTSCDAILFKDSTIRELSKYDHNEDIVLCQPGGVWSSNPIGEIHGGDLVDDKFRAIAGGGGFFISNSLMKKCYPIIDNFNKHWSDVSGNCYPYSDVAFAYMINKYFNIKVTHLYYILGQPPSHYESAIIGNSDTKWYTNYEISLSDCLKTPMSFHYIKPDQMEDVYEKYK